MSTAAEVTSLGDERRDDPVGVARLLDAHSFVFWVAAVAAVYGGSRLVATLTGVPSSSSTITWLALVEWSLYGLVFVAVVQHHQLFVRRSPVVSSGALVWGGAVATWFALQANAAMAEIFDHWFSPAFNDRWGSAFAAATNEESLKSLGIVVLALLPLVRMRSALDGWFYGMLVGLGFQVVEDFVYTVNQSTSLNEAFVFLVQRGFIAGLFAHAVYSGIVGVGVGYFVARTDRTVGRRLLVAVGLFLAAWTLHFLWDLPHLSEWLGDSPWALFATVAIKGLPALFLLFYVVRRARERERLVWTQFVRDHIDPTLVPAADSEALLSRATRTRARRAAAHTGGHRRRVLQERLQWAQLRYVQHVQEVGDQHPAALRRAEEIRSLRAALAS